VVFGCTNCSSSSSLSSPSSHKLRCPLRNFSNRRLICDVVDGGGDCRFRFFNGFESPNLLDTCQLQQSSDQPIIIDDSQSSSQTENLLTNNTQEKNKRIHGRQSVIKLMLQLKKLLIKLLQDKQNLHQQQLDEYQLI